MLRRYSVVGRLQSRAALAKKRPACQGGALPMAITRSRGSGPLSPLEVEAAMA